MTEDIHCLMVHWAITEKLDQFHVEEWVEGQEYLIEHGPYHSRHIAELMIYDRRELLKEMTKRLLKPN